MLLHSWYISSAHAYFELSVGTQYSLWIPTAEVQWGDIWWLGWLYNRPSSPTDQGISDLKKCKGFCGAVGVPSCWNVYPGGLVNRKFLNYICAGTWTRSVSLWRKQEPVTWFFVSLHDTFIFYMSHVFHNRTWGVPYPHIWQMYLLISLYRWTAAMPKCCCIVLFLSLDQFQILIFCD